MNLVKVDWFSKQNNNPLNNLGLGRKKNLFKEVNFYVNSLFVPISCCWPYQMWSALKYRFDSWHDYIFYNYSPPTILNPKDIFSSFDVFLNLSVNSTRFLPLNSFIFILFYWLQRYEINEVLIYIIQK